MPPIEDHDNDCQCIACSVADPDERRKVVREKIDQMVEQQGFAIMTAAHDPEYGTFSYTIGLAKRWWPELVLTSLGPQSARMILKETVRRLTAIDTIPTAGMVVEKAVNTPLRLGPIADKYLSGHLILANDRAMRKGYGSLENTANGPSLPALQVIWPDTAGLYPDNPLYDHERLPQPLLS